MASEQGKIKLSSAAAAFLKPDVSKHDKIMAASGQVPLATHELSIVLLFLCHDADVDVKETAIQTLREMPEGVVLALIGRIDVHPRLLDVLARLHFMKNSVAEQISLHESTASHTLSFLAEKGVITAQNRLAEVCQPSQADMAETEQAETDTTAEKPEEEASEEYKSKYKQAQSLGVAEKIKMAISGDKEWRSILIKDSNKMVSGSAIKNPRMTESEVLGILKSPVQNDEVMRIICGNKEWVKNYNIRKALVENSKTPLPNALRFLGTLGEKDVAAISKSKNVSSVLSNQAKRMVSSKNKK